MDWMKQLEVDLRRHEGCRLSAYRDTQGIWTIGYGHTGPEVTQGLKITQEEADLLLLNDIREALVVARKFFNKFDLLSPVRKTVIANMAFNLGNRLDKFVRLHAALNNQDWKLAGLSMQESLWARQTKGRAVELTKRMITNEI